jgi:hypothetical protein
MDDLEKLREIIPMQNIFEGPPDPGQPIVLFITSENIASHESETYAIRVVARDISTPDERGFSVNAPEGITAPITLYKLFDAQNTDPTHFFQGQIYAGPKVFENYTATVLDRVNTIQFPFRVPGNRFTYLWAQDDVETVGKIQSIWTPGPPAKKKGGKSFRKYNRRSSLRSKSSKRKHKKR